MFQKKGFTLVELAIVMTIIGLLIGGILKGQELLENARVTSTIAQIKSYDAAVTAFRDIYDSWPGDLLNAANRIPGCNENCSPSAPTAGDAILGSPDWCNADWNVYIKTGNELDETWLFWQHLLKANLIAGVNDQILSDGFAGEAEWGVTHPAAKTGGGFIAAYEMSGCILEGAPVGLSSSGNVLQLRVTPGSMSLGDNAQPGQSPLTPLRAQQIDTKMDDGTPDTGSIVSWGKTESCFGAAAPYAYNSSVNSKDCGLDIFIQR